MSLVLLAGLLPVSQLAAQDNVPPGTDVRGHVMENVIDLGIDPGMFEQFVLTQDCGPCYLGFTDDRFDFTLTAPRDVVVDVADCCVPGDRFEVRFNDRNADEDMNADLNNHEEDCIAGRQAAFVAPDVFDTVATTQLPAGDWTMRVRDVAFQCDDQLGLCAAGYTVRISFGPPSAPGCGGLPPCMDIGTGDPACQDVAGPAIPALRPVAMLVLAVLLVVSGLGLLRRRLAGPRLA